MQLFGFLLLWLAQDGDLAPYPVEGPREVRSPAEISTRFCAIVPGALDDQPIARSSKLLLTAGSKVANTGMAWNEKRTSLEKWGGEPTVIEPVRGRLALVGIEGAKGVEAQPPSGRRKAGRCRWEIRRRRGTS